MAYNYLGLVNEICAKVNEVELTSSNFSTATGFYQDAKNAVNRAIDYINLEDRFWRFNFIRAEETLTANPTTGWYTLPANSRVVDFDSFLIQRDETLNVSTRKLTLVDYDEYQEKYIDFEYDDSLNTIPRGVVKSPGEHYILFPRPDKAYTLSFDYFSTPTPLSAYDDIPTIPEKYRLAIFWGAMAEIYDFRDDEQKAEKYSRMRDQKIEDMRGIEIDRYKNVRSSMLERDVTGNYGSGYKNV